MSIDARPAAPFQVEEPAPRRIRTTGQAREARRQARIGILRTHDYNVRLWRSFLADEPDLPPEAEEARKQEVAAHINHHLDRMEYQLDKIEAGL